MTGQITKPTTDPVNDAAHSFAMGLSEGRYSKYTAEAAHLAILWCLVLSVRAANLWLSQAISKYRFLCCVFTVITVYQFVWVNSLQCPLKMMIDKRRIKFIRSRSIGTINTAGANQIPVHEMIHQGSRKWLSAKINYVCPTSCEIRLESVAFCWRPCSRVSLTLLTLYTGLDCCHVICFRGTRTSREICMKFYTELGAKFFTSFFTFQLDGRTDGRTLHTLEADHCNCCHEMCISIYVVNLCDYFVCVCVCVQGSPWKNWETVSSSTKNTKHASESPEREYSSNSNTCWLHERSLDPHPSTITSVYAFFRLRSHTYMCTL